MAMTLRLDEAQEKKLDELTEKLELKTRSKTIAWLIENFDRVEKEKLENLNEAIVSSNKLRQMHRAFSNYREAEKIFRELTSPPKLID